MPAATSALSAQRGRPPKLRRDSWALAEVTPSRAAIRRAFTSISVIRAPAGPRLGRPAQSGKPAPDTAMVRARAPAWAAEADRAVPAGRGGAGWGAACGGRKRIITPVAIDVTTRSSRPSGTRWTLPPDAPTQHAGRRDETLLGAGSADRRTRSRSRPVQQLRWALLYT